MDLLCIACTKSLVNCQLNSESKSIKDVFFDGSTMTVFELLTLLSDYKQIEKLFDDTDKLLQICIECYNLTKTLNLFKSQCDKSIEYLKTVVQQQNVKELVKEVDLNESDDNVNWSVDKDGLMDKKDLTVCVNPDIVENIKEFKIHEEINELNDVNFDGNVNDVENDIDNEGDDSSFESDDDKEDEENEDEEFKLNSKPKKKRKVRKAISAEIPRVECPECHKLLRKDYMKAHQLIHTGEKPFKCELCDKPFRCKKRLQLHLKIHADIRDHLCAFCGKSFHSSFELKVHTRTHTKEKPFVCETCGKAFTNHSSLAVHRTVHTGIRNYCCDKCPKTFCTGRSLRQHKVVHAEVKPFLCTFCGKRFPHKHVLKSHQAKTCGLVST